MAVTTITHFEITELPDPLVIEALINAVPIVAGTLYPIADQNLLSWERTTTYLNVPLSTVFKYKVHDNVNNFESNEALGKLIWIGSDPDPLSSNLIQVINNLDVKNLLTELPINNAVDFIKITGMVGVLNLKLNGSPVFINQILTTIDLANADFTAEVEGGGDPYFELTYQVGQGVVLDPTIYTYTLDVVSAAEISSQTPIVDTRTEDFDVGGITIPYTVKEESIIVNIDLGSAYGTAEVTVQIASPFLILNIWNSVAVIADNINEEYFSDTTIITVLELDKFGKSSIEINNFIVYDTIGPKIGQVTITLDSINEDISLVNGSQIEILSTNL